VVARSVAARAGAPVTAERFRPVLCGLLLTGSTPGYLRAVLRGGQSEASEMDMEPLWWPPSKIAGYYLGRHIAALLAAQPPPEGGIRIEVDDLESLLESAPGR
jgi:hypothetical protein